MIVHKNPYKSLLRIPSALIHEVIDGKPIYYKGCQEVVSGNKAKEVDIGADLEGFETPV